MRGPPGLHVFAHPPPWGDRDKQFLPTVTGFPIQRLALGPLLERDDAVRVVHVAELDGAIVRGLSG